MKLVEERDDVIVGGAQSVETFTIKASGTAFHILSSQLYSNKVGAVVRELSTNAYDAHVMIGAEDKPFEITLPNSLEPTFKIRDFGPGLSEHDIEHIYTTFFESTKSESNDFVGCLGLGSKSPFAVSDSFTVTSYFNGKKIIYSAFLSDAKIPSIAKFAEFQTDEPNGLEIEVAVKDRDFYVYMREVNSQLKYFKVKPTIFGASDFVWQDFEEYLYEGDGWKLVKGRGNPVVVQGQIQYPIHIRDMGAIYSDASPAVKSLLDKQFIFEVPIGDVGIAPSREALSYDDKTSNAIIQYAEKIISELPIMIKEIVGGCSSEYEARIKYGEIISTLNDGYYGKNALVQKIIESGQGVWQGKDITSTVFEIDEDDVLRANCFTKQSSSSVFKKSTFHCQLFDHNSKEKKWRFEATPLHFTVWVHATNDDAAVEARAKQYVNEFVVPKVRSSNCGYMIRLNVVHTTLSPTELAERLGINETDLLVAADLDKVKRVVSVKRDRKIVTIEEFNSSRWGYTKTAFWDAKDIFVEDVEKLEGLFVPLERYNIGRPDGSTETEFKQMVNAAIELGLVTKETKIYGIRKSVTGHNLTNFYDYVVEQAKTATLSTKYVFSYSEFINKCSSNYTVCEEIIALIGENSPAKKMLEMIVANVKNNYSYDAKKLIDAFKLHSNEVDATELSSEIDAKYPMIGHSGYYLDSKLVAEYINQMDTLRSLTAE